MSAFDPKRTFAHGPSRGSRSPFVSDAEPSTQFKLARGGLKRVFRTEIQRDQKGNPFPTNGLCGGVSEFGEFEDVWGKIEKLQRFQKWGTPIATSCLSTRL